MPRKFVSNVLKSLPVVSSEMENYWNSHSNELREFLAGLAGKNWKMMNGVIHFNVISHGTTGPQWIERSLKAGHRISDYAMGVLLAPGFKPTTGVTTKVAVLPAALFYKEEDRPTTERIREWARQRRLGRLNAEVACLVRDKFSDRDIEAMGLAYIAVCHKPIKISTRHPNILGISRQGYGNLLDAYCGKLDRKWDRHGGFAFAEE